MQKRMANIGRSEEGKRGKRKKEGVVGDGEIRNGDVTNITIQ